MRTVFVLGSVSVDDEKASVCPPVKKPRLSKRGTSDPTPEDLVELFTEEDRAWAGGVEQARNALAERDVAE